MPERRRQTAPTALRVRRLRREDDLNRARLRAVGFALDGGSQPRLDLHRAVGADRRTARERRCGVGEGGEILGEPPPLPDDEKLLALAIMREKQTAEETPEFEIGFDMLHMRVAGDAEDGVRVSSCEWML